MVKRKRIDKATRRDENEVDRYAVRVSPAFDEASTQRLSEAVRAKARSDALGGERNAEQDEERDDRSDDDESGSVSTDEETDDFRAIVRYLDIQDTEDLRIPLSIRAHFERLVERLWSFKISNGVTAHEESEKTRLLRLIRAHPAMGSSPFMLRWPLSIESVPQPRWSLADEVHALLEKSLRARQRCGQVEVGNKGAEGEDEEEDEGEEDEEEGEEGDEGEEGEEEEVGEDGQNDMPMSILLPTVARCQASLSAILHDLSHRITRGKGQQSLQRRDVLTWRDVMKCIEGRPDVHSTVLANTQERLHAIFGAEANIPAAILLSYAGQQNSALTGLLESGDRQTLIDKSERYRPVIGGERQRSTSTTTTTANDLDEQLLLYSSREGRSRRFLAKPAHDHSQTDSVEDYRDG